jgi:hypothetical protein
LQQSLIDRFSSIQRTYVNNQIDQGIEIGNGATIVNFGILNSEGLSLTVDAFTTGALLVNGVIERIFPIERVMKVN